MRLEMGSMPEDGSIVVNLVLIVWLLSLFLIDDSRHGNTTRV